MSKLKTYKVEEGNGNIPYIVIWVSLDGRIKTEDYSTYEKALKHFEWLKGLKRQPSIYLNLHPNLKPIDEVEEKQEDPNAPKTGRSYM